MFLIFKRVKVRSIEILRPTRSLGMAPFHCPPPGCYARVVNTWELTNEWTGRSTVVHSRLQPPQWPQKAWDDVMLHTGVPQYALDEFHRLTRPERRVLCGRDRSRSRSRGRDMAHEKPGRKKSRSRSGGRYHDIDRIHKGEYKDHIPTKNDFTFKHLEKKPSQKELKSILKHKDDRLFFDDVKGPYYGFNTSSDNPIVYAGHGFLTAEHLLIYFKVS